MELPRGMGSTKSDERPAFCAIRVSGHPITHAMIDPNTGYIGDD